MRPRVVLGLAAVLMVSLAAVSQDRAGGLRTVTGHVLNNQDQPLQKAVVHLKNTKTLVIKTYITEPDGTYRFSALSPNVDYEIYAEFNGQRSVIKTLSAFDSRKEVNLTLKIRGA